MTHGFGAEYLEATEGAPCFGGLTLISLCPEDWSEEECGDYYVKVLDIPFAGGITGAEPSGVHT